MLEVTKENIKEETAEGVVLVDFFATWCGPCKMLAPQFQLAEEELSGVAKLMKADIEQLSEELLAEYGVMAVPTLVLLKDGVVVKRGNGFHPKDAIVELVKENL